MSADPKLPSHAGALDTEAAGGGCDSVLISRATTTWTKTGLVLVAGVAAFFLLPGLVGGPVPASETSCGTNGWCKSDAFDIFWAQALLAPNYKKAAFWSHVINFFICAAIAFLSTLCPLWSRRYGDKSHAGQDSILLVGVSLFAMGFNGMVKILAKRQRPCFYYGAQAGSEGM